MVRSERSGRLRVLVIDRPEKRNALTLEMIEALAEGIEGAASDPETAGLVVTGEGPCFSAGVDLRLFAEGDPGSARVLIAALARLCAAARRSPKPVACAVDGPCLGGAFELALACDFRVATAAASFGLPEMLVGIPSVIDAALLERFIGLGRARDMILTGEAVAAARALEWGLLSRIMEPGGLLRAASELVGLALRSTPDALRLQKALFEDWLNLPFQAAADSSREALAEAFLSGEPQRIARERLAGRRP